MVVRFGLEFERRCPLGFAKQIIHDLVLSCIIIEQFWKFVVSVSYVTHNRDFAFFVFERT